MTLDKATREAIAQAVTKNVREVMEVYEEIWLTGDQLCREVGFFTKEWLKRYGCALPRERVKVVDIEGVEHHTGWCYPKKKILRMLADGQFRQLSIIK